MAYISKIFVTVDVLIVRPFEMEQQILLIKRKNDPFKDCWALPGGFVDENEDLEQAAIRELVEETQVKVSHLEQIGAFGKPYRDPRGHMVSIAYLGKVATNTIAIAADDAKEIGWFSVTNLPSLAFDHSAIIEAGLQKLL
ncbi:NUDIX domain-containing protein [Flavobacterium celericrescens]|uniref:NUDIX hydrolase n=1 Tax=Flavobacterium celericrescens TaxID=2709780 RepID=A0ABX0IEZ7_9FLAO|nr:NUDIX hydrolase [Flavobacterium celericrescens]NHM05222.1 NUDIX hydrolase [Flavobacterium celericrescens]